METIGLQALEPIKVPETSLLRWHLIFTKPCAEHTAQINLERQGYRVYFPRVRLKKPGRAAWRETISALFPRYLFIQLNAAIQSLAPVRSTLGVANVVRFGVDYAAVPEKVVNDLMSHEDETGLHRLSVVNIFKTGAAVRIIEGAFAGMEGIFQREDANDRVSILLNLLGREAPVKLPPKCVGPLI